MADKSRQAMDLIVASAPAAVCPGVVIRQSQSLFKDSTDQNTVPVRIEKAGLRYSCHHHFIVYLRLAAACIQSKNQPIKQ